jgi:hypothetical protein
MITVDEDSLDDDLTGVNRRNGEDFQILFVSSLCLLRVLMFN